MSEKTKLSAGALRAATGCFNLPCGSAPTKSTADWTVGQMARIIDRETGMAELLDAAKIGLSYIKSDYEKPPGGVYIGAAGDHVRQIEQAIAKAEAK